jgi:hypothetical protein
MVSVFYAAASIAVLLIGAGLFWACYQVVYLLKHVRLILLPQVEMTLTEVQKNLNHIDTVVQDVDTTVGGANELVASAGRTVASVEESVTVFNKTIAVPLIIGLASSKEGLKTAWKTFRANKPQNKAGKLIVIQEPVSSGAPEIGILQP